MACSPWRRSASRPSGCMLSSVSSRNPRYVSPFLHSTVTIVPSPSCMRITGTPTPRLPVTDIVVSRRWRKAPARAAPPCLGAAPFQRGSLLKGAPSCPRLRSRPQRCVCAVLAWSDAPVCGARGSILLSGELEG